MRGAAFWERGHPRNLAVGCQKLYGSNKHWKKRYRFHKTILNEFCQVTFRKTLYGSMEELQKDLDEWMDYYNNHRTHQGKMCCGRTPIETLEDGKSIWAEKNLAQI